MARVVNCEVELLGNVGNLNYSTMYGTNYVRTKNIPRNPKTPKQQAHRSDFGEFQSLGGVWLYGLINNYYRQGAEKKQPYRMFIKYNWAKWTKTRKAFWEAIPIFQYGNFCTNFTVQNGAETQITYTFDASMIDKVFETLPRDLKVTVMSIKAHRDQVVEKRANLNLVANGNSYTLTFSLPRSFYSYDDYAQNKKSLLTNIFYENVDTESGQLKTYPFQNSINTYSSRELVLPDDKIEIVYDIDIAESEHGKIYTDKSYAKAGEEVNISYFAEKDYVLKSIVSDGDIITEDELMSGKFIMPMDNVTLIATFEKGDTPAPTENYVKVTVYNNYDSTDDSVAFNLYAPKDSEIVNPFKCLADRKDYVAVSMSTDRAGQNVIYESTDVMFVVGEQDISLYTQWQYQPQPIIKTYVTLTFHGCNNNSVIFYSRDVIFEAGQIVADIMSFLPSYENYTMYAISTSTQDENIIWRVGDGNFTVPQTSQTFYALYKKAAKRISSIVMPCRWINSTSGGEYFGFTLYDENQNEFSGNFISNTAGWGGTFEIEGNGEKSSGFASRCTFMNYTTANVRGFLGFGSAPTKQTGKTTPMGIVTVIYEQTIKANYIKFAKCSGTNIYKGRINFTDGTVMEITNYETDILIAL